MAAQNIKAVVKMHKLSGIPRDDVVNDWYFHWDNGAADPATADYDVVKNALAAFYSTVGTGMVHAVGEYISEAINRGIGPDVEIYTIPPTRGPLGAPVYTSSFALAAAGTGTPLPSEMAICLSYRSDYSTDVEFGAGGTRPRSSHRGRVYIGPLEGTLISLEDGTTHEVTVGSTPQTDIAMSARLAFSAASPGTIFPSTHWTWGQFSRTHWLRQLVTTCWVDNEFDVQRRRGLRPTTRQTKAIV